MSIFAKPVSQISTQDLCDHLEQKAVESVRLEFKREIPSKDEILKKLSSFANTFGGFLVIGAEAKSSDGRIAGLPGVDIENGYKQTVAQWCFGGVHPPLAVEVSDPIPSPDGTGKVCYVLYTGVSDVAPHFLNGRKGVYVRTDEFSSRFEPHFATDAELRYLVDNRRLVFERRSALLERARQRFRALSQAKDADPSGDAGALGPHMELFICPRFPVQPLCEQHSLRLLLEQKRVSWRRVEFPTGNGRQITQHESAIVLRPCTSFSILEANVWGALLYAVKLDDNQRGEVGIHLNRFVGHILVFLRHAASVLSEFGYKGPLFISMTLKSIRGVPSLWYLYESVATNGPASELDDEVSFSLETTQDLLDDDLHQVATDLLRYAFFAMNLPDSVDSPQRLAQLLRGGYKYNLWE